MSDPKTEDIVLDLYCRLSMRRGALLLDMPRSTLSLKRFCDPRWNNAGGATFGIHVLHRRCKDAINTQLFQKLDIGSQISGVTIKILVRSKLGWIDKNGNHHAIALLASRLGKA